MVQPAVRDDEAAAHPFDRSLLGPEALELFANGFRTLERVRAQHPGRFIDVEYRELVQDPLAQFRRLLRAMGLEPTTTDERAMQHWMASNSRDTHPPHRYRLEDYGVSAAEIRSATSASFPGASMHAMQGRE